jgi:5-methyltetrahydropteroyltriglutamate--homocysteine methyltransferase
MKRSGTRILTTHVGSLIRPADLLERSKAAKESPQEQARYEHTLRCATVDVVEQQVKAGIDIVNDGEFGKSSWSNYVLERLTGFERRPDSNYEPVWLGRDRIRFRQFMEDEFPRGAAGVPGHVCVAPIAYRGHEGIRRNIAMLKAALTAAGVEEGFLTAVAPGSTGYDSSNEFYADDRDYVFAIAEALREEYLEIVDAGLILQVDEPVLAHMYDELGQLGPAREGADRGSRSRARKGKEGARVRVGPVRTRGVPAELGRRGEGGGRMRIVTISEHASPLAVAR